MSEQGGPTSGTQPVPLAPARPADEADRMAVLRSYQLPEGTSLSALQDLTDLASHICQTPIALVTLIGGEKQWWVAKTGPVEGYGSPRDIAFCAHTILERDLFVVSDATADARFADNPFVNMPPSIRFYAGMPLVTPEGCAVGTLCVIDLVVRELRPEQKEALRLLGRQVVMHLELRRSLDRQRLTDLELQSANARLELRVAERTAELEAARSQLELAIQVGNIGWWAWHMSTDELYHSPSSSAQLGYTPEAMPRNWADWRRLIHPDDLVTADAAFHRFMAQPKGDFECELRVRHGNGSLRWLLTRARLYQGADGDPERMFGCHIDITERRAMEEELRAREEQLRGLAAHINTAREEEAGRIARELHDELGSTLTGLKLDVGWLERQWQRQTPGPEWPPLGDRLQQIGEQIDGTMGLLRRVCRDLRPAVLDELGLATTLEWLGSEFQSRTGIPCSVGYDENVDLTPEQATAIFRIVQELLTNVARHAGATAVQLAMRREAGGWLLEVEDNGRGLPPGALARQDRFGLMGLRERVLAIGGRVEFAAGADGGTRVQVSQHANP